MSPAWQISSRELGSRELVISSSGAVTCGYAVLELGRVVLLVVELQMKVCEDFTITEKAPTKYSEIFTNLRLKLYLTRRERGSWSPEALEAVLRGV